MSEPRRFSVEANGHITHMEFWRVIEERDQRDRDEKQEIWSVIREGATSVQGLTNSVNNLTDELTRDRAARAAEKKEEELHRQQRSNRLFAVLLTIIAALLALALPAIADVVHSAFAIVVY